MEARKGCQTPTIRIISEYERTRGDEAAKLYDLSANKMMPWQRDLLNDMMAVDEEGLWKHIKFGFSIPRRNGKTEAVYAREAWGLIRGEKILHTAHLTATAHASWEALYNLLEQIGVPIEHTYKANGREHIFVYGGGRIEYRTRTSKGGLGEGYDLLVIDEAQEYQNDHETALKYIVAASKNPQTIMLGTPPTPVSSGTVFRKFRDQMLSRPKQDSGWVDWENKEGVDIHDREAWYKANPSLGYILTERTILSELSDEDESETDFAIQRLGVWIQYNLQSLISEAEWNDLKVENLPELTGKLFAGIKYGADGGNVAMSIAARTVDNCIFVESIDCRPMKAGNAWMIQFLCAADVGKVIIDGASGQDILKDEMKKEKLKVPTELPTVKEVIAANALFEQLLDAQEIRHMGQPSLVQAVTNCDHRNIGSKGGFGYKAIIEGIDISLMDSMILAMYACATHKEKKKQKVSY